MKKFLKSAAFVLLTCIGILLVYFFLDFDDDWITQKVFKEFYALEDDSIDIVNIGNSCTARGFVTPEAWDEYGAATYSMAVASEPFVLTKNLMKEVEKTQNPQVYIIDLRDSITPGRDLEDAKVRRVTDNMKESENRIDAINTILDYTSADGNEEIDPSDKSYYFKLLKYHSLWNPASRMSHRRVTYYNGFTFYPKYEYEIEPQTNEAGFTTESKPVEEQCEDKINELLDYCDSLGEDTHVVFVISPYAATKSDAQQLNYVQKLVEKRGYPVLNFLHKDLSETIGVDYETSFYDYHHMNLPTATIYTDYMMEYVKKNYGITDHRGESEYAKWQEKVDTYNEALESEEYKTLLRRIDQIQELEQLKEEKEKERS